MKVALLFIVLTVLGVSSWYILSSNSNPKLLRDASNTTLEKSSEKTSADYSASFAIFTNGTFRIFTATMYHDLSRDVYIESSNPNIVRVKKSNITWDDFFKTLPFKLTRDCLNTGTGQAFCTGTGGTLKFYINGKLDKNALNQTIGNGDKLLVTFGNETEAQIQKQIQQIPSL